MWTDTGSTLVNTCANAYGSGGCLKSGTGSGYAANKITISAKPAGYSVATMPWDLTDSFGTTSLIPIPKIPAYFFPGKRPIKPLANGGGAVPTAAATSRGGIVTNSTAPSTSSVASASVSASSQPSQAYQAPEITTPSEASQPLPSVQPTDSPGLKCKRKLKSRHFQS